MPLLYYAVIVLCAFEQASLSGAKAHFTSALFYYYYYYYYIIYEECCCVCLLHVSPLVSVQIQRAYITP